MRSRYLQIHHPENISVPELRNRRCESAGRCTCGMLSVHYRIKSDTTYQPYCLPAVLGGIDAELRRVRAEMDSL